MGEGGGRSEEGWRRDMKRDEAERSKEECKDNEEKGG